MKALDNLKSTLEYLPAAVRRSLQRIPDSRLARVQEIRLRSSRPVGIAESGREQFLTANGTLTLQPEAALTVSADDIARSFQAVVSYSVYSHEQDTAEGYVTIRGGCRVGICGSAVRQGGRVQSVRNISGLNFRIAGEYLGTAASVMRQVGQGSSLLVAGEVGSGKTTFLRDICRMLGNSYRTALIDERGELAAVLRGVPQNDVGLMTDVLDGYPRAAGIRTALRVLTPDYIVCDEIGTLEDAEAILQASGCGVRFAASAHAGSIDDLKHRTVLQPLLEADVFRYAVLLGGNGRVQTLRRLQTV